MNIALFNYLHTIAGYSVVGDYLAIFFAHYSAYLLCIVLAVYWFISPRQYNRHMVITAFLAGAVAKGIVTELLRFFYHNPRPFVVLDFTPLISGDATYSFPSGHATFFFALSTVVYLYNKKLGIWFFAGSLLMGIARIVAGVHWPADIAGGILIGIVVGILVYHFSQKVIKKRIEHLL